MVRNMQGSEDHEEMEMNRGREVGGDGRRVHRGQRKHWIQRRKCHVDSCMR